MQLRQVVFINRVAKPLVFIVFLSPAFWLIWQALERGLGANPIETITHHTGEWGLRLLLITLAITPLRRLFSWNWLQRFRRMLGLFAFFYICLHFLTYLVFDHFFNLQTIFDDITKRPYITVGFAAFLLLIPLAITSTNAMIRRMGRNWQRLHRLIYIIAVLSVLHFTWLVKAGVLEPLIYISILAVLFFYRLWFFYRRSGRKWLFITVQ